MRLIFFLTIIPYSASKNVILLKDKEYGPVLLKYININNIELLKETVLQNHSFDEKLDDDLHFKLSNITRVSQRRLRYTNWTYSFIQ